MGQVSPRPGLKQPHPAGHDAVVTAMPVPDQTATATPGSTSPAPLRLVVLGVLVVAIDLNLGRFDLLVDPVGYAIAAVGVHRLTPLHPAFGHARIAALVGLVASIFTLLLRRTETVESGTGGVSTSTTHLVEPVIPGIVESLAEAAFVILVCTALIALVPSPRVASPARTLRWALPTVTLGGSVLALALLPLDGTAVEGSMAFASLAAALAVVLIVLGIALGIWFLLVLWRSSREPVGPGAAPLA